jgi:Mor family transcriptional regulator
MPKILTEDLKDAVVSDYLNGVTTREIIKKHKTYKLYSILNERGIEYKQDNDNQKERQKLVVELYLNNFSIEEIIEKTGYKDVYKILKKFGICRNRDPKKYNKNKKEERNIQLIEDYKSRKYSIEELSLKYNMSTTNIYRIFKVYDIKPIRNANHHWVINQKVKNTPNIKCKFYILENYYGYTKIGITTKNKVKDRYRKNVNVFYETENTLEYCYNLESKIKKLLKSYIPKDIDRNIDGWSECYTLSTNEILDYLTF